MALRLHVGPDVPVRIVCCEEALEERFSDGEMVCRKCGRVYPLQSVKELLKKAIDGAESLLSLPEMSGRNDS